MLSLWTSPREGRVSLPLHHCPPHGSSAQESVPHWVKYGLIESPKVKLVCVCMYVCMCLCECTLKGLEGYTLNLNVVPYRQVNRQASKIWKCDEAKWEILYSLCSCIVCTFLWQCTHISSVIRKLKDRTIPTLAFFILSQTRFPLFSPLVLGESNGVSQNV